MFIDSHCHLNHNRLKAFGSVDDLVNNASDANVSGILTICCKVAEETGRLIEIANAYDNVWCTIGTHPHDAAEEKEQAITKEQLCKIVKSDPKIVGIGESGLDYYYKHSPMEAQQVSLRKHIQACLETDLPLVIHAREADEDIIRIIKEETAGQKLAAVMHCFSSGRKMGEDALALGLYISFSGMLTFNKSADLKDFAKEVPLDRILIETDAPYLAPEPYRGKINQPAFVPHVATTLSDLLEVDIEAIAQYSKENFFTLFKNARKTYKSTT